MLSDRATRAPLGACTSRTHHCAEIESNGWTPCRLRYAGEKVKAMLVELARAPTACRAVVRIVSMLATLALRANGAVARRAPSPTRDQTSTPTAPSFTFSHTIWNPSANEGAPTKRANGARWFGSALLPTTSANPGTYG